jgi:hypothetical protein
VKVQYPPAHFDIQFIIKDEKLDDVGIFTLVCDRLPVKSLGHITPAGDRDDAIRLLADKHRQPRDPSRLGRMYAGRGHKLNRTVQKAEEG